MRQLIKITYVGHSMGGMTLPMYVVSCNMRKKPHHLSQAILISPAGFHSFGRVTNAMHYIGHAFYYILPLFCDHIALPDSMVGLLTKLKQELIAWGPSRSLCQYLTGKVVGGNGDFIKSARVVQSTLQFGFSMDLAKQFF